MSSLSDDELAVRAASGDKSAFKALVERHLASVHRMAARAVGDPDAASDIVQETFVRIWRKLPGYDPRGAFKAWLYRVAVNVLRTHLRRVKRKRALAESVAVQALVSGLARRDGLDSLMMVKEARGLVRELLASLPPKYREPFLLKHVEGMSYEEVSAILGVSVGALKVRVHRAREKLARLAVELGLVTSDSLDAFPRGKEVG